MHQFVEQQCRCPSKPVESAIIVIFIVLLHKMQTSITWLAMKHLPLIYADAVAKAGSIRKAAETLAITSTAQIRHPCDGRGTWCRFLNASARGVLDDAWRDFDWAFEVDYRHGTRHADCGSIGERRVTRVHRFAAALPPAHRSRLRPIEANIQRSRLGCCSVTGHPRNRP